MECLVGPQGLELKQYPYVVYMGLYRAVFQGV